MAKISVNDTVSHPRDLVYETFRDRLDELDQYLPDIKSITTEKRDEVDQNTTYIVRLWNARDEDIPKLASKFIKPEMLQWTDRATWHDDKKNCDWEIEVGFMSEAITATGTNHYNDTGDGVEIIIDGDLEVDASQIPGVPGMLSGRLSKIVEGFVVKMITPNLKDVNRGIEKYLAAND